MEQGILQRIQGQLDGMGLPRSLHRVACQKILGQVFDAGATFQFQESSGEVEDSDEDGADTTTVEQSNGIDAEKTFEPFQFIKRKYDLATIGDMKAYSDVFLIDHMWYDNNIFVSSNLTRFRDMLQDDNVSSKQTAASRYTWAAFKSRFVFCITYFGTFILTCFIFQHHCLLFPMKRRH